METERGLLLVTDASGRIGYVSRSVENWSGFSVAEAVGAKPGELWGGNMDAAFYESMWKAIAVENRSFSSRLANRSKSGRAIPSLLTVLPVIEQGRPRYFFAMQPLAETWNVFEAAFEKAWPRLSKDPKALAAWIEHWIGTKLEVDAADTPVTFIERALVNPMRSRFADREVDRQIVEAAKQDVKQFAELFGRYFPLVHGYVKRRLSDSAEAEDLAQDVFIKALNGLSRFTPQNASYKTYLLRIAHHELLNRYRRHAAERRFIDSYRPIGAGSRLEDRDALERAIEKLGDTERRILRAFYVEDKPVAQIARQLGKTENAVKLALSRSRKHLRDTF